MPQPIASPVTLDNAQSLSGTPKMTAQNVNFFYGSSQALFDVSLTFPERQVTALIGPSGCGKSTFLRCLNRMNDLIPGTRTEGLITLDKEDINAPNFDVVNLRRRVGMVFQKPTPFPKTIFENVAYALPANGERDESLIADKVEESLRRAAIFEEVKDRLHTSALGLSGVGGIIGGYFMYFVTGGKFNPVIGIAGVSCVPSTAKVAQKCVTKANPNAIIMHYALGVNIFGVITTAIIAAIYISLLQNY